jgi:hypothetical protein
MFAPQTAPKPAGNFQPILEVFPGFNTAGLRIENPHHGIYCLYGEPTMPNRVTGNPATVAQHIGIFLPSRCLQDLPVFDLGAGPRDDGYFLANFQRSRAYLGVEWDRNSFKELLASIAKEKEEEAKRRRSGYSSFFNL